MKGRVSSSLRNLPVYQRPPAEKIGKYKVLGTLGRGGMGIVYKGLDPDIEREVAIKTIRFDAIAEGAEKQDMLARVVREAKAAGRLNHPNIITIYDVLYEGDLTFIVMQYIDGQSLQALVDTGKRFSPAEVIDLLRPVADALDYAHQNGIVHRDIKPANILIDKKGRPYLADFGVARMEASTMTGPGKTIGTLSYMSPEQVMGGNVDHRADIFALGVILYELLTGKKPFAGDNLSTIVYKIVNEEPPRVTEINRDLPRGYEDVVRKVLAKKPEERYQSGRELVADLEDPSKLAEATRAYGSGIGEPAKGPAGKKWRLALAGGLIIFAVLAGAGYKILSRAGEKSGAGAPDLKALNKEDMDPATRSTNLPLAPEVSPDDENLAKLKGSFEGKNYDDTIQLAEKILAKDPTNTPAGEYRDKAREGLKVERLAKEAASIVETGVADYNGGDYAGCVAEMEKALKLDGANKRALDYLHRAEKVISEKEIDTMLGLHCAAEEGKDLYTILNLMDSPDLASESKRQYKEWFNGYDAIKSRIPEKSIRVSDRSNATVSFFQTISGIDRKDKKNKVVFEGRIIWALKKVAGAWKIIKIG
jgi:predicted Ser/Thr protein kinase/tetratricopeptide (TPR) repeat protein